MSFTRRPGSGRLHLEWYHARRNWTAAEWNQAVFSDANPDPISAVMTIVFVCGDPLVNASILPFLYSDTPLLQLVIWVAIAYNTRSPLILIRGTMAALRYVDDIRQPHVLPLIQRFPGAIFQQDNARAHTAKMSQDCLHTVTTFPGLPDPQICLQSSIYGIIWDGELGISRVRTN
ncbi:transposable element Tcb2 transposase [Trichonephila clavipes]|nr:transposable element Tcb2 transposase [Trichonephila clavipes]